MASTVVSAVIKRRANVRFVSVFTNAEVALIANCVSVSDLKLEFPERKGASRGNL